MVTDRQEHVVRAVESIADSTGPCLVHCVAGKDRTGVVVAAVLAAVGVPDRAIVADFVRTNDNLDAILKRIAQARPDLPAEAFADVPLSLLQAPAEAIAVVLDILASHPGGAAGWLVDHGLSASQLARLRDRLTE
jgi:hypothetical protein